jgi:uncharacterized protein YkwD
MRAMRPSLICAFLLALGAGGCSGTTTDLAASIANPLDPIRIQLLADVNQVRSSMNLGTFTDCATLNVAASAHSDDMRDNDYLSDTAPDGSTPRSRACSAGYTPACSTTTIMAELVAQGQPDAMTTVSQWTADPTADGLMLTPSLVVAGIGRSIHTSGTATWSLDLGSVACPE